MGRKKEKGILLALRHAYYKLELVYRFFLRFASVFSSCSLVTQPPDLVDRDGEKNEALVICKEIVNGLLNHLNVHQSVRLDGIYLRLPRKMAKMLTKTLYQQSWLSGEIPVDWQLANVMPVFMKG